MKISINKKLARKRMMFRVPPSCKTCGQLLHYVLRKSFGVMQTCTNDKCGRYHQIQ